MLLRQCVIRNSLTFKIVLIKILLYNFHIASEQEEDNVKILLIEKGKSMLTKENRKV